MEVLIPTTFVILDEPLPEPPDVDLAEGLLQFALSEDGSGIEVGGEVADAFNSAKERFDEGRRWLDGIVAFGKDAMAGDVDAALERAKGGVEELMAGLARFVSCVSFRFMRFVSFRFLRHS